MAAQNDDPIPFRKDGYIDSTTGMYTVPDPAVNDKEFQKIELGQDKALWLPMPALKPKRMIQFATPHAYVDVQESMMQCREMIDKAKEADAPAWFQFTEPTYGTLVAVHRDQLRGACWIAEGFVDLDALKTQIQLADHQKNMARMQLLQAQKGKN